MDKEPVAIWLAGFTAMFTLCLAASNILGWTHLDVTESAAVIAAVGGICTFLGTGIRATVYSPATHEATVQAAVGFIPTGPTDVYGEDAVDDGGLV